MKKLTKSLAATFLCALMMFSAAIPAYANDITYIHGNETYRCFAETTQTGDATIGAKITWQLSNSNTVASGDTVTSSGPSARSRSKLLIGKTGKSFGYYYVNGKQTHKSTAWMNFDF
ncbi:hypothetical protein [Eubacterium sp.]